MWAVVAQHLVKTPSCHLPGMFNEYLQLKLCLQENPGPPADLKVFYDGCALSLFGTGRVHCGGSHSGPYVQPSQRPGVHTRPLRRVPRRKMLRPNNSLSRGSPTLKLPSASQQQQLVSRISGSTLGKNELAGQFCKLHWPPRRDCFGVFRRIVEGSRRMRQNMFPSRDGRRRRWVRQRAALRLGFGREEAGTADDQANNGVGAEADKDAAEGYAGWTKSISGAREVFYVAPRGLAVPGFNRLVWWRGTGSPRLRLFCTI